MIRMVLFAVGFVAITIGLLVFQPGSRRDAEVTPVAEPVTRAVPALEAVAEIEDVPQQGLPQAIVGPEIKSEPEAVAERTVSVLPSEDLDDQSLRRLTWDTLSNLNTATGRETAPGQPGSLLHTIVKRSLDEGAAGNAALAPLANPQSEQEDTGRYIVQPGDSLVSIAETVYGDVNMTGPLFAANQALLARPDDLRPGQTLVLPVK